MPALGPVNPAILKKILELIGFTLQLETDLNWTLLKRAAPRPIITIPKRCDLISGIIVESILTDLQIDNAEYFRLRDQAMETQLNSLEDS